MNLTCSLYTACNYLICSLKSDLSIPIDIYTCPLLLPSKNAASLSIPLPLCNGKAHGGQIQLALNKLVCLHGGVQILALPWNHVWAASSVSYQDVLAQAEHNADMTMLPLTLVIISPSSCTCICTCSQSKADIEIWTKIATLSLRSWLAWVSAQLILYVSNTTESHRCRYSKDHFNSIVERKNKASKLSLSGPNLFSYLCSIKEVQVFLFIYRWHFCYARVLLYVAQLPENKGVCLYSSYL